MNEKFNKNAKVEKLTTMLGIAVRLIVIDPLKVFVGEIHSVMINIWGYLVVICFLSLFKFSNVILRDL